MVIGVTLLTLHGCHQRASAGPHDLGHLPPEVKWEVTSDLGGHMPDSGARAGSFTELLDAMPRIAEAANAFKSEENQRSVLAVLLRALGLSDQPSAAVGAGLSVVPPLGDPADAVAEAGHGQEGEAGGPRRRSRKSAGKKSWTRVHDIDFRPAGKEALRDFAASKVPVSFDEKNLVIVYYLEDILKITPIGVATSWLATRSVGGSRPAIRKTPSRRRQAARDGWTRPTGRPSASCMPAVTLSSTTCRSRRTRSRRDD